MKNIELLALNLKNFKGIDDRRIELSGSANIYAANEIGKSTLFTAYMWCQTGKDEFDRADYEIKNTMRLELNKLPHEVEIIWKVNGRVEKFKRVYVEDWVKPAGQATKVFKGHSTQYYYNDVPCKAKDYIEHLEAIIPIKYIKLLSNPSYFNTLDWQDQRKGLLTLAGPVSDDDIINAIASPENDYSTLIMVLNSGKKIENYKKELQAKKLLLKKAAVEFVPRIDEAKRNKPLSENWVELQGLIDLKIKQINTIDEEINSISKAASNKQQGIILMQNDKFAKETELASLRQKIKTDYLASQGNNDSEITMTEQQISTLEKSIKQIEKTIADNVTNKESYENQLVEKEAKVVELRAEWDKINAERFDFDEATCLCPTCKQRLPVADVETKKLELQANFNKDALERKSDKVTRSNQVKTEIAQLKENINAINAIDLSAILSNQNNELKTLLVKLENLKASVVKKDAATIESDIDNLLNQNDVAATLQADIKSLNASIEKANSAIDSTETQTKKATKKLVELELKELENKMAVKKTIENTDLRIAQLETEESANAQAIAELERQEFELESFTRAKMDIIEKRVNCKFKHVKFRLFHRQVNGEIDEDCVCEYKGVPFPTLNTAGKLFAGLDVLKTFSEHCEIMAPVFIDNRESVTIIPDTKLQIISLYVSKDDKVMRIEAA